MTTATAGTIKAKNPGRTGTSKFIVCPMASTDIGEVERGYINAALIANEIGSKGGFIKEFENKWAEFNHFKYGVACNSGTSALHLAIEASGAKRILMPNFTMAGTVFPALQMGLEVNYVPTRKDLPLAEHNVDYTGYDAVVFAHIYGRKAYPNGFVKDLKASFPNLIVIDDMAEAHGIHPEGDIACYSFHASKIITTGEGGMCITNISYLADEMRSLANMYFDSTRSMIHPKLGHNFRMTNLTASIGVAQIDRIGEILERRDKIKRWYNKFVDDSFQLPEREVVWYYDVRVKNAKKMQEFMLKQGLETRRFFYPISLQPWGNQMPDDNALEWYKHGLLLPAYNEMNESDVRCIAETLEMVSHRE